MNARADKKEAGSGREKRSTWQKAVPFSTKGAGARSEKGKKGGYRVPSRREGRCEKKKGGKKAAAELERRG